MEICRQNESLEIRELDPFLAELLRQIPDSVNTKNSPAAEERLLSAPAEAKETEFRSEWKLYVVPELRRLFQSSTALYHWLRLGAALPADGTHG